MRHCLELPQLERVYHFGVRGLSNRFSASSDKQRILWLEDIRTFLATQKPSGVWAELAGEPDDCYYYITLDIDVLDPAVAPGTATPVINGLNLNELVTLFRRLLPNKRIIGLDLVELDPTLDHHGLTTQCAINLLLHLLNLVVL
jgi:agmatinase